MPLISQDDKVEEAGSNAVAEAQACGLTGSYSLRNRYVAGASVLSWTAFHQPFPPSQTCHTFHCVQPWKKSKIACW